jgi:hypothetical protein
MRGKDAQLSAVTTGPARGGVVTVGAAGLRLTDGASVRSSSAGTGDAGGILITAGGRSACRAGRSSPPRRLANAGTIKVAAGRSIDLTDARPGVPRPSRAVDEPGLDNTRITAEALRGGQGNIKLDAPDRVYLSNSVITAESLDATGARIDIDPVSVVLDNSVINGRAAGADVPVTIVAQKFVQSADSLILSDLASVPVEVDIAGSLSVLSAGFSDDAARLAEQCGLRVAGDTSSFVVTGRGGAPASPDGWLPSRPLAAPRRR